MLTVEKSRAFDKSEATKGFQRMERSFGSLVRSFAMPPQEGSCQAAPDQN
jgi:hypothetical protein